MISSVRMIKLVWRLTDVLIMGVPPSLSFLSLLHSNWVISNPLSGRESVSIGKVVAWI